MSYALSATDDRLDDSLGRAAASAAARRLPLVADLARELSASRDLDDVTRVAGAVVTLAARELPCDRATLLLRDGRSFAVRAVAGDGVAHRADASRERLIERAGWVAAHGEPVAASGDAPHDDAARRLIDRFAVALDADGVRSLLYVPLADEWSILGVLALESSRPGLAAAPHRDVATQLAAQATAALRAARRRAPWWRLRSWLSRALAR